MKVKEYFKVLTVIHFFLLLSGFLVGLFGFLMGDSFNLEPDESTETLVLIAPIVIGSFNLVVGYFLFRMITSRAKNNELLFKKCMAYRNAFLLRSVMIEGSVGLCILAYLLLNKSVLLIFASSLWAILFKLKPSKEELKRVFELNFSDAQIIENDNTEIISTLDLLEARKN